MKFEYHKLGDYIHIKHGYAFKSQYFSFNDGNKIVLTPGNFFEVGGFKQRPDKDRFYTGDFPNEFLLKRNDLIIAMTEQTYGLLGSPAIVPENDKYLHNQRLGKFVVKNRKLVSLKYFYYLFLLRGLRDEISNSASGTKIRHTAPERIYKLSIPIPLKAIQRKIAAVLSAYDDLIENNNRRIAILEKMAEELYREWFVRLRFPGHENTKIVKGIPEGWEVKNIGNIISFLSGYSFKSKKYLLSGKFGIATIKNVQDGHYINEYSDFIDEIPSNMKEHCKLNAGDVLMSLTGNVGRVCRVIGDNALLNQRVAKLKPKISSASQFIYYTFRTRSMLHLVENLSLGSTAQMNLSPIQLSKQRLLVPSKDILEKYEKLVLSISNSQISSLTENSLLAASRDRLLSRLMSGAIDVENLDIEFPKSMKEEAIDA